MAIDLSEDIIVEEILSRLPGESLLRFRSVSKSWFSRISSSHFIELQSKRASGIGSPKLIVLDYHYRLSSLDCRTSCKSDHRFAFRLLDVPLFPKPSRFKILGSANGLVCICSHKYDRICVWNPYTNEYIGIPSFKYLEDRDRVVNRYGFGHDASADDYKLLISTCTQRNYDDVMIHIFSLRKGKWICFQDAIRAGSVVESHGVFLNGALYWVSSVCTSTLYLPVILSFRFDDECFKKVDVGDVEKYRMKVDYRIGVFDGSLCLSATDFRSRNGDGYTIWTMKEYGVGLTWTELTTVRKVGKYFTYSLLRLPRRGEILLLNHLNKLVCFDRKRNSVELCYPCLDTTVYMETLISPRLEGNRKQAEKKTSRKVS